MRHYCKLLIPMLVFGLAFGLVAVSFASSDLPKGELLSRYGAVLTDDISESMRPAVRATRYGVVSSGHYAASMVGYDVLRRGGNAFDAGVAAAAALNVMKMDMAGWAGVAPFIGYVADEDKLVYRPGVGVSASTATRELYEGLGYITMPTGVEGHMSAIVPASFDAFIAILQEYGTISLAEALEGAILLAEQFPLYSRLARYVQQSPSRFYDSSPHLQEMLEPRGRPPELGEVFAFQDLAKSLKLLVAAEQKALAQGKSRNEALEAARDVFYKGPIAREIAEYYEDLGSLLRFEDFANWRDEWREPIMFTYTVGDDVYEVACTDTTSQGALLGQFLNMLEPFDLPALGHNSAEYVHLLSSVIDLAMSDRWYFYGDPNFVEIPDGLWTKEYATERMTLFDPDTAFPTLPPMGDPWQFSSSTRTSQVVPDAASLQPPQIASLTESDIAQMEAGTSSLAVADMYGNLFSMTPSDNSLLPNTPGVGIGLGQRGYRFTLIPGHPAELMPSKTPMNTPNPTVVLKNGKPFMSLNTPGADQQAQSMLQVFLNVVEFGMNPQEAVDQPRFGSYNFPATGSPHAAFDAQVRLERGFDPAIEAMLTAKGHAFRWLSEWNLCSVCLVVIEDNGVVVGGADVRREGYAVGW